MASDEEEDDGEDEEEAEKGGATECEEGTRGEEEQGVVDEEPKPAPAQQSSPGPSEKEQEGGEEMSQAGEDTVTAPEAEKAENSDQTQNDKEKVDEAATDQPGQSEENSQVSTESGNENGEPISVNNNQGSHSETEGDIKGQSNPEESAACESQKLPGTETDTCQTVTDDKNKVTVEEAEQSSPAEPMETEAEASEAVRGEESTGTGVISALHSEVC